MSLALTCSVLQCWMRGWWRADSHVASAGACPPHRGGRGGEGGAGDPPQQTPSPPPRHLHRGLLPHLPRPPRVGCGPGGDACSLAGAAWRQQVTGHSAQPSPEDALEQHRGESDHTLHCVASQLSPEWYKYKWSAGLNTLWSKAGIIRSRHTGAGL